MNVDPVPTGTAGTERQTREEKQHAASAPRSADPARGPKTEIAAPQNGPVPFLIPEHEVKVQLDTPEDDIVIYQVLNKQSGALVLQVPSAEQLRGIHQSQELLQRIAARGKASIAAATSAPAVIVEEENNGRKL
jgi:hypothetical protein